ncbi:MAG TPA: DUF5781 family protein [Candidatus Acidoferrum sp.]|nr:DUF5781 family protein [Candidatus Acidoferrum sp.]
MKQNVEEALRNVLNMMEQAGFRIDQNVKVIVNDKLPFMGYTFRQWQSHVIVVSGFAVESPMLEGLLTHELSHVYRNITNHPSHSEPLIASLIRVFINDHRLDRDYEQETLHQAINHIQDLYADDIAVRVLAAFHGTALLEQFSDFFLGWIKEEPATGGLRLRNRWVNASILLNNSFAISNMERHNMMEGRIEEAKLNNDRFLNRIKSSAAIQFSYFNRFMVDLEEDVSEVRFHEQMEEYLDNFLKVVDNI